MSEETVMVESKMVELPISEELYELLEKAGAKRGLTASEFAQKIVLENLDRLRNIAEGLAIKTLTTNKDKEEKKP